MFPFYCCWLKILLHRMCLFLGQPTITWKKSIFLFDNNTKYTFESNIPHARSICTCLLTRKNKKDLWDVQFTLSSNKSNSFFTKQLIKLHLIMLTVGKDQTKKKTNNFSARNLSTTTKNLATRSRGCCAFRKHQTYTDIRMRWENKKF